MVRSKRLTQIFRSIKTNNKSVINPISTPAKPLPLPLPLPLPSTTTSNSTSFSSGKSKKKSWEVYLIMSTNPPIKTYVGSTSNFSRRLKQHNGELSGGAKATRSGKPWVCACLIRGFTDQSEACVFESKWKAISKKLPRKKKNAEGTPLVDGSLMLLPHRQAALNRVKGLMDCSHLEIDWQMSPS